MAQVGLIVHRVDGDLPRTVLVRFFLGKPDAGGSLIGEGQVPLLSPNSSGSTTPVQWIPSLTGNVDLYAVIDPDNLVSERDENNNTVVRSVTVLAPQTDTHPPVVAAFVIGDGADTTTGREVTLNVTALDPGTPASGVAAIFFVEYQLNTDLGIWVPIKIADDWLPYTNLAAIAHQPAATADAYPWQLTDQPGMRYLQVWAADHAGNISLAPKRDYVNYVPSTLHVGANATMILRFDIDVGVRVTVHTEPLQGDPDIYLWAPDALTLPRPPWYSNLAGTQIDQVDIVAPVEGVYQLEIVGYEEAEFSLDVEIVPTGLMTERSNSPLGTDPTKGVHSVPLVPPTVQPGDAFSLMPPAVNQPSNIYLPAIQR